jgi:hypothetical protein
VLTQKMRHPQPMERRRIARLRASIKTVERVWCVVERLVVAREAEPCWGVPCFVSLAFFT